jgi:hypothetical protein
MRGSLRGVDCFVNNNLAIDWKFSWTRTAKWPQTRQTPHAASRCRRGRAAGSPWPSRACLRRTMFRLPRAALRVALIRWLGILLYLCSLFTVHSPSHNPSPYPPERMPHARPRVPGRARLDAVERHGRRGRDAEEMPVRSADRPRQRQHTPDQKQPVAIFRAEIAE